MNPQPTTNPNPVTTPTPTTQPSTQSSQPTGTLNVKNFITQARAGGTSDADIYSYLNTKGYVSGGKIVDQPVTPTTPANGGYLSNVISNLGNAFKTGGQNAVSDINNTKNLAEQAGNSPLAQVAATGATAGHLAGDVASTVGNIFGSFITPLLPDSVKSSVGDISTKIDSAISNIPGMTPEIQKSLGDVFNTATLLGGSKVPGASATISDTANAVKSGAEDLTQGVKNTANAIGDKVSDVTGIGKTGDPIKANIDAVDPTLSGKAKTGAYADVVGGGREVKSPGIFQEQGLTPNQRTVNLGTRLNDAGITLTKDPIKNLDVLNTALKDTETKLTTALKGDPDVSYNLQKPALLSKLDTLKVDKPGDFIGDNGKIYDNVVKFGKNTITKAEDSINGGRDARTAFDNAVKKKFPTAFKNGVIDESTPAGHAIKAVRDTINQHIYETAPNGSDIQKLVGQEADIFRARDTIAPKAAASHGQNIITKTINTVKAHPVVSTIGTIAAAKGLGL